MKLDLTSEDYKVMEKLKLWSIIIIAEFSAWYLV